jgi:hypothetical protein
MMVLGFFKVDRKCCQPFKVFSRKKSGAGKTTNPTPDRNTHTHGGKRMATLRTKPNKMINLVQGENDLAPNLVLK